MTDSLGYGLSEDQSVRNWLSSLVPSTCRFTNDMFSIYLPLCGPGYANCGKWKHDRTNIGGYDTAYSDVETECGGSRFMRSLSRLWSLIEVLMCKGFS